VTAGPPPEDSCVPPASRVPTTIETVTGMLQALGTELDRTGWTTRLQAAPGRAPAPVRPEP
jgi:hypothetical protein